MARSTVIHRVEMHLVWRTSLFGGSRLDSTPDVRLLACSSAVFTTISPNLSSSSSGSVDACPDGGQTAHLIRVTPLDTTRSRACSYAYFLYVCVFLLKNGLRWRVYWKGSNCESITLHAQSAWFAMVILQEANPELAQGSFLGDTFYWTKLHANVWIRHFLLIFIKVE